MGANAPDVLNKGHMVRVQGLLRFNLSQITGIDAIQTQANSPLKYRAFVVQLQQAMADGNGDVNMEAG